VSANLIILFAKSPAPGRVKTRLLPAITPEQAAELHIAFVNDMVTRFRSLENCSFELHADNGIDAFQGMGVSCKSQIPGDLGLRMIHALDIALQAGHKRALILGSDAPTLPIGHVRDLLASQADIAIGPATDGGFYAISAQRVHPAMFERVVWSRPDTMARSLDAIARAGLSADVGPAWFDIDGPEDLAMLQNEANLPPHTAACLDRVIAARRDTC
jgi:uncharacterized protein